MSNQKFFNFVNNNELDINNFYVNKTNINAFELLNNKNLIDNIILNGPNKSGKSHLANIWKNNNNAIIYDKQIEKIILKKQNLIIDDLFLDLNEENIFHLINHCNINKLKILITTNLDINQHKFILQDLLSRLKTFNYVSIQKPDDEILINVLTKLLIEKQFVIRNKGIFDYLLKRVNRTYEDIYQIVEKMNTISLEKKRQLTIPLIRELI